MKTMMIGAVLLGSLAAHGAQAAVRTFDFTATVNSVSSMDQQGATVIPGPVAGTSVTAGDLVKGQFSFDDLGHAWSGGADIEEAPALSFSWTLLKSNTTIDVDKPNWTHWNDFGGKSVFRLADRDFKPSAYVSIESPLNAFSWELGNGTSATFVASWSPSLPVFMFTKLTSLTEVSPVPEPSTWGMLLVGAAVAAGAARRARRTS